MLLVFMLRLSHEIYSAVEYRWFNLIEVREKGPG